ncbi:MAG: hypothetical protein J6P89_11890 [Oscillospiraceae bacterium]|nr:hypothetical protein [Oscillospiraceae bacterium]
MEYRLELMKLGKKQVDLVKTINSRDLGYSVTVTEMSMALSGLARPKLEKIRQDSEKIIDEWKAACS